VKTENNTEQLILEAAEAEFLEKGYNSAATTAIAKRAGVTHAMLHYYFRTKENLFQKVFQTKVHLVGDSFYQNISENLSFVEAVRKFIESHFEFVRQNPKLLGFIYNEVVINAENRSFLSEQVRPKMLNVHNRIAELLADEVSKGNVRPINVYDLLLNIISMNIMTFIAFPIIKDLMDSQNSEVIDNFINARKESNVQFVLNALKL
jgi:AcrR family transcriptional regulator